MNADGIGPIAFFASIDDTMDLDPENPSRKVTLFKHGLGRILSLHVLGGVFELTVFCVLWVTTASDFGVYGGLTLFSFLSLVVNLVICVEACRWEKACTGCVYSTLLAQETDEQITHRPAIGYRTFLTVALSSIAATGVATFLAIIFVAPALSETTEIGDLSDGGRQQRRSWLIFAMSSLASMPMLFGLWLAGLAVVYARKQLCYRCKAELAVLEYGESKRLLKDDINRNVTGFNDYEENLPILP